jgi:hypothetical protein
LQEEGATILAEIARLECVPATAVQKTEFGKDKVLKTLLNVIPGESISCAKVGLRRPTVALAARRTPRKQCQAIRVAPIVLMLASFAAAQTLAGRVKNSTTGKPSAGDDVVVFKLDQGMEEAGRTKTDAKGRFSFKLGDAQTPYLVRAIHQGVTYHRMALPGTASSVAIDVYDVAKKVNGIGVVADIMRIQASHGEIAVTRDFGVRNTSNPPRTQMNERNLEFYIPDGAQLVENSGTAITENGAPVKSAPVPEGEKNRYSFIFPLRPGLTRFEMTYKIPYSGSANLDPRSIYPLEHFMVMLPKSMQFEAAPGSTGFKLIRFPNVPDAMVQTASNTTDRQNLAFNISGEGTLESGRQSGTEGPEQRDRSTAGAPAAQSGNRPGGGLGRPIDAPDPLQKYRWWILGSSAAMLLIGGVYVASRQQAKSRAYVRQKVNSSLLAATLEEGHYDSTESGILEATHAPSAARANSVLIAGIKEELSQIEMERKQGQISQAQFERVKAALDQTLDRALKREAHKTEATTQLRCSNVYGTKHRISAEA